MTLRFDITNGVVNEFSVTGINDNQVVVTARVVKIQITNTNTNDTYSLTLSVLPSFSIIDNRMQFELISGTHLTLPMTGSYVYEISESGLDIHTAFVTNTLVQGKFKAVQPPQSDTIANDDTYIYSIPNTNI